ncbi:hypothetical protein FQA47_011855 [Oryzias melastigma]|uniref:Uncharacterized protein n=1 Tax=Oryzias melastigma TaxID=30732 RepID=A0A834CPH7_ORYME|nr:hypothetical protein FQA47_011855 [Oryzias melastigma]
MHHVCLCGGNGDSENLTAAVWVSNDGLCPLQRRSVLDPHLHPGWLLSHAGVTVRNRLPPGCDLRKLLPFDEDVQRRCTSASLSSFDDEENKVLHQVSVCPRVFVLRVEDIFQHVNVCDGVFGGCHDNGSSLMKGDLLSRAFRTRSMWVRHLDEADKSQRTKDGDHLRDPATIQAPVGPLEVPLAGTGFQKRVMCLEWRGGAFLCSQQTDVHLSLKAHSATLHCLDGRSFGRLEQSPAAGLSREEPVLEQSALVLEPEERQGGPEAGDLLFITA